jgi:glucuronokinase
LTGASSNIGIGVARAGLAGNPSDALGGAAIAIPIPALAARVELVDADHISVRGPVGAHTWGSMDDLDAEVAHHGHEGADRLVTAALVTLWRWAGDRQPWSTTPFQAVWSTDIPRSVGLAGSSALIVATMRAAAERWGLSIDAPVLAGLALETERTELGLPAGWMDRAVQAHNAPTWMDARTITRVDGLDLPLMRAVTPAPIDLVVAWDPTGAAPSRRLHGGLRDRHEAGDPAMVSAVASLVHQAEAATAALESGDRVALRAAVSASCELRRELGALDERTAALVDHAHQAGAAATSAGSGGAVSVVPGPDGLDATLTVFAQADFPTVTISFP